MRNIRADLAGFVLLCALLAGGNAALAAEAAASAAVHPGQALYEKHCSACHDKPDLTRAVPFAQLRNMRLGNLFFAMTDGKMKEQAKGLNERQRGQLVDFIVGRQVVDERWIDAMRCGKDVAAMRLPPEGAANVLGFGFTRDNRRQLTREQAGLSTAEVKDLELAWVLAFPRASTMRAQAAIAGDTLFLPVTDEVFDFATSLKGSSEPVREEYYRFSKSLASIGAECSQAGPIVHIFTEYFGGNGTQGAIVWNAGVETMTPDIGRIGTINSALRKIGIRANSPQDEFDTIGLGRYRSNDAFEVTDDESDS